MDVPKTIYRDLRGQQKLRSLAEAAPVAAKFEDCHNGFYKLCGKLKDSHSKISMLADDNFAKFLAWGNDTGAATRSLDHTLRKSSDLKEMTLDLLKDLHMTILDAIEHIENLQSEAGRLRELIIEDNDVEVAIINDENADSSEKLWATDKGASELIEQVNGTVRCLIKLVPNLCDPFPGDLYSLNGSQSDAYPDIDLARGLFPSATPALISRLGKANWKRRQYLKMLQEKGKPGMPFARGKSAHVNRQKKAPLREIAVDAFNFQKPTLKTGSFIPETTLQVNFRTNPTSSISGVTEDQSVVDTVFTGTGTGLKRNESVSSFTMSHVLVQPKPVTKAPLLKPPVPKAPVPLEKGQTFKCPYCADVIDVGKHIVTDDDWECHLYGDLEPYLCTFDNCLRPEKTYGARDEWYGHELDCHRIMKVWVCEQCAREEFDTAQAFEEHLQQRHGNICGPSQVAMIVSLCVKHSDAHLKVQTCPLCAESLKSHEVKDHISNHLEQLAITSVDGDNSSEEDDSDEIISQKWDDNVSEGRTKLQILNAFVEEQFGIMNADDQEPPDRGLDRSNLDFAGDSDEEGSSKAERPAPRHEADPRNWRMTNFLDKQPAGRDQAGEEGSQRSRSPVVGLHAADVQLSRSPNPVPLIRTVSHPENEDFIGRDKDLANLYKILSVSGRLCIVSGTGGMGKTATAVEFTYRYEQSFNCIFWVQAETPVGAADTFSLIATALNLAPDGSVQDQERMVELGREFLEKTPKRWLLVFDNVNEWAHIEDYLPTKISATNGSILITTRLFDLSPNPIPVNYFRISLRELQMEEGRSLLIKGLRPELRHEKAHLHPEWKIAGEIAGLAGLPLAILHISGYVKASGCTLAEFLELWNEWRRNSLPAGVADLHAPTSDSAVQTILNIGLGELGVDAMKLIKILAFLDSDCIQKELLFNDHPSPGLQFLNSSSSFRQDFRSFDPLVVLALYTDCLPRFRKMVQDLSQRRLITIKNHEGRDIFQIHRLLQHRLLQDMNTSQHENDQIFRLAFELVRQRLPRPSFDTPEPAKWNLFREYLPHVLSLQKAYARGISIITPYVGLAQLFRDGGILLWQRFIFNDAVKLLNSAESILDKLDVKEDQLRADIHIATTLLIQYFGISHRAESRDRFWKILQIRQEYKANTPPEKYTLDDGYRLNHAFADYANALLQFNDYKGAEPIYQKCYATTLEWGAENDNPFECAKLNHHMAFCKMYHRDFNEAIRLSERAIELVQEFAENSRQLLLRYRFDLACIILQSGDKERALEMHKEILLARENLQGRASYFTLQSYYAVGALCSYLGRHDEAEQWMRTALARAQERAGKNFWPEAAVARTQFHLYQILTERGNSGAEATWLATEARAVLSRLLPFDPLDGVKEEDEGALFDHLQPVFGGRFTGLTLIQYVS